MKQIRWQRTVCLVLGPVAMASAAFAVLPPAQGAPKPAAPTPDPVQERPMKKITLDFEKGEAGKPPADFTFAVTGGGGPAKWEIAAEKGAPSGERVLMQTSRDETDLRFPVAVHDKFSAKDVAVSVRFKAISGEVDRAAGLVARFADKGNYYVVRANALEDNVRLYKVVGGERKQFAGADTKVTPGAWHTLTLDIRGKHFKVSFDGKSLFEADDETFTAAGKAGVWTKADSVTAFDDLVLENLDADAPK